MLNNFSAKIVRLPSQSSKPDESDAPKWITPKKYAPSRFMQSRQLGVLDPSLYISEETEDLYETPPGHVGRLWFILNYRKDQEQLTVGVAKARNLKVKKETSVGQVGDCFVKVYLEQDERRTHCTTTKKKTNNPTYNETFCYQLPQDEMMAQTLNFAVFHVDRHKRQKAIGYVHYPLKAMETYNKEIRLFRDLDVDGCEQSENPELKISLTFHQQSERLTVGIFECRNLPVKDNGNAIDVYVKISLNQGLQSKEIKSKKTDTLSNGNAFNESFSFNKISNLDQISIRLTLVQPGIFDKPIGIITLGSDMFAKRKELDHWREMTERPEEQVSYWHQIQMQSN